MVNRQSRPINTSDVDERHTTALLLSYRPTDMTIGGDAFATSLTGGQSLG
jgi:hypothetical protein